MAKKKVRVRNRVIKRPHIPLLPDFGLPNKGNDLPSMRPPRTGAAISNRRADLGARIIRGPVGSGLATTTGNNPNLGRLNPKRSPPPSNKSEKSRGISGRGVSQKAKRGRLFTNTKSVKNPTKSKKR